MPQTDWAINNVEKYIVNGVILGLGAFAILLKGLDAANAWVRHKERLTLDGIAKAQTGTATDAKVRQR